MTNKDLNAYLEKLADKIAYDRWDKSCGPGWINGHLVTRKDAINGAKAMLPIIQIQQEALEYYAEHFVQVYEGMDIVGNELKAMQALAEVGELIKGDK